MIVANAVQTLVPILFQGTPRLLCRTSSQGQYNIHRVFIATGQTEFSIHRAFTSSLQSNLSIILSMTSSIQTMLDIWGTEQHIN
ncbi:MAG: hypothetical protein WC455_14585 [Dehalococcoidia bacterium]|jgi:hypothetical protein